FGEKFPEYQGSCAKSISKASPARSEDLDRRWGISGGAESAWRHFEGRVVQRQSGALDVWDGSYPAGFSEKHAAALTPYNGKFVNVIFGMPEGKGFHKAPPRDEIQRVTVLEDTPHNFHIEVTIEPAKGEFTSLEPIVAMV